MKVVGAAAVVRLRLGMALALGSGLGIAVLATTASSALARGESDPMVKLRTTESELHAAVNRRIPEWSPEASSRQIHIDRLLRDLLDYEVIARRALGEHYDALPPAKRREFVAAFAALTGQTFLAKMEQQQTRTRYDSETIRGNEAHVSARGIRGDEQAEVEYVLERRNDEWMVTDVVIDGLSLVAGYQEQFRPLIAREGVDGLLERMRNRLSSQGNK